MIDWIIMIFLMLDNLGILSFEQMLTINLLLVAFCRAFYLIAHALNNKEYSKELEEGKKLFTRNETIYFSLKQIVIILFGISYFPIAVFVSVYSLLISGSYLKQIGEKRSAKSLNILGNLITIFSPLIGILWSVLLEDYLAIAAIGISLVAFIHYGWQISSLSLSELVEKSQRRFDRIPKGIHYVILLILIVFPCTIILGTAIYSPPAKQTVYIPMRDGVGLASDIYLAPGSFGAPRPVILARTTYGKNGMGSAYGMLYLTQGYHLVVQDIRGCFDSEVEDDFILYMNSFQDGIDTINWILKQNWCNGKIASVGASALAIDEYFYAGMNPNGLVSQSLMIATPDLYKTSMYQGGAFKESIVTGWIRGTAPLNYEYQLEMIINHPKKDLLYNTTSLFMEEGPNFKNINVRAIHIGGWYDTFQQGTLDGFMGYDDLGLDAAQGKQLLIMGPFTHGMPREGKQGELVFPTKSKTGFDLYLEWEQKLFDHMLLGMAFDWTGNRVAYYMMGDVDDESVDANDYRFAKDWPIPYENETWYFNSDGLLSKTQGSTNMNYSYIYDPRDPVPTLGGTNLLIPSGPYDQRSIESRSDVLIFETPELTEKMEVVGHMWAHLFVMSNCTNTDFTVKITDVYPDGRSMLISDGIINAIRRDGFDKDAAPLNSSGPVEVVIDLWSTAYQFNVGHKIRIAISSSNYPRFAINPNTGAPQSLYSYQYLERYIANNTILVGPAYPSYIILPSPSS
ncbi:MAG: CocE/NonD family hydrolase [Candidatus Hermodarchaeota archaeon]